MNIQMYKVLGEVGCTLSFGFVQDFLSQSPYNNIGLPYIFDKPVNDRIFLPKKNTECHQIKEYTVVFFFGNRNVQ
jgi:hypothetical protein